MSETDLQHRLEEASREAERLRAENERLRTLLALERQRRPCSRRVNSRHVPPLP